MSDEPGAWINTDGLLGVCYDPRSETSLRDGIAEVARHFGWCVDTERHLPGWGRIDLCLSQDVGDCFAVELKLRLDAPSRIRRAFQQADAYAKAMGPATTVVLTAPTVNRTAIQEYDFAFPSVWCLDVSDLLYVIRTEATGITWRLAEAMNVLRSHRRACELSTAAVAAMEASGPPNLTAPEPSLETP